MRQEFVRPFLSPTRLVWRREFGADITVRDTRIVADRYETSDITVVVGIGGRLTGNVMYGFGEQTSAQVANRLIGANTPINDPMTVSAIGEIANMITGNAVARLAAEGFLCEISPPVIMEPRGVPVAITIPRQVLVVLDSDLGSLAIRISLSENMRTKRQAA